MTDKLLHGPTTRRFTRDVGSTSQFPLPRRSAGAKDAPRQPDGSESIRMHVARARADVLELIRMVLTRPEPPRDAKDDAR